jgi:hypothetical protein
MIGKASNSQIRTVALGTTVQSSTYGQTIPAIYGRAKSALYLIWAANLRMGASGKAAKKASIFGPVFSKLFGLEGYLENVDFLVGHNPIMGALQFWVNQTQWLPLNFAEYSQSSGFIGPVSITIGDPLFYSVIGVTVTMEYGANFNYVSPGSVTFDDYGGQGPQTYTGSYELPLWNQMQTGPNPTDGSAGRNWPYVYRWQPGDNVIYFPVAALGQWPAGGYTINVYYAQLDPNGSSQYNKKSGGTAIPIAALNMAFEYVLGSGDEYALPPGNPAFGQQIKYPHYAGMGSVAIDLGETNSLPNIQPEVQGAFGLYSTGDADFGDIIEDIFDGATQAGQYNASPTTPLQHGLNCQNYPGPIQNVQFGTLPEFFGLYGPTSVWQYPLPNTAGNFLVVSMATAGGSISGISDTAGNTWTAAFSSPTGEYQVWTATAKAYSVGGRGTTLDITWGYSGEPTFQGSLMEFAGVDTLQLVEASTAARTLSISTSGAIGNPAYILAFAWSYGTALEDQPAPTFQTWDLLGSGSIYQFYGQAVFYPGTYSITFPTIGSPPENISSIALFAFTNSQAVAYPKPLGDILDHASLDQVRQQCRAAGLYGSLTMDSQKAASDWLKDLYAAADAAAVWSGFELKSIPWSEVSAVGNGAIYIAPTASGPIYAFTESDFIGSADDPLVTVDRTAQIDVPDLLQIQQPSRAAQYNDVVVSQPETAAIALYGPRKASPTQMRMFQDPAVGRMYLGIMIRRQNYMRNEYSWKAPARFTQLEAMDLVTIPLSATMPNVIGATGSTSVPASLLLPVRLTSVEQTAAFELTFKAQDFIYGTNAPVPLAVTAQVPNFPATGATPASVNPPVIFEPPARLAGNNGTGVVVWIVVSNSDSNYGGAQVSLSVDDGNGYNLQGSTLGNGTTGELVDDWPAAEDPDSTNNLVLDLTESNGVLSSFSLDEENNFLPLSYVAGTGVPGAYVQKQATIGHSVTTLARAFTDANVDGNAIVVAVGCYNGNSQIPAILTISDSQGNKYIVGGTTPPTAGSGITYQQWAFVAFGIAAGANTITVTSNVSVDLVMAIHEYSGVNSVDGFCGNSVPTAEAVVSSGGALTKFDGDLIFTCVYDGDGSSSDVISTSAQWTLRERVNNSGGGRGAMATYDGPSAIGNNATFDLSGEAGPVHALTLALARVTSTPQPGVVQPAAAAVYNSSSVSTLACAFDNNITDGNAIAVCVWVHSYGSRSVTIADTLLNTYTLVDSTPVFSGDGTLEGFLYTVYGSPGGANTITVTVGSPTSVDHVQISAYECSGVVAASGGGVDGFNGAVPAEFAPYPIALDLDAAVGLGDVVIVCGYDPANGSNDNFASSPLGQLLYTNDAHSGVGGGWFQTASTLDSGQAVMTFTGSGGGTTKGNAAMIFALQAANPPLQDDYELMSYAVADMTAASMYTLDATGSGNQLRRAVYGEPAPNQGDDHPAGSRFAYVGQGAAGIVKLTIDAVVVGQQLNFKFPAFNSFAGGLQGLTDVPAYGYTIKGTNLSGGGNTYNYAQSPAEALTNPTSTTIDTAQVTVDFPSNAVNYNARTLAIPAPSVPTQYFVTIYDPSYLGDPDSSTALPAQAETTQQYVGALGYTYLGSIIALPAGGGTTVTPGGMPLDLGGGAANFVEEIPAGALNGANTVFTLSYTPNPAGSLNLFLNGVEQIVSVDFSISGPTITFTVAPKSTDDLIAQYTH